MQKGTRMNIILETDKDKAAEIYTINRLRKPDTVVYRYPKFAIVDFMLCRDDKMICFIEMKVRKESLQTVQGYGGLIIKYRKLTDLCDLQRKTSVPTYLVFAFENGHGHILYLEVPETNTYSAQPPPRRRNFRNLTTDQEPVIYLDWNHLITIQNPEQP
jgi:hypothetical protein